MERGHRPGGPTRGQEEAALLHQSERGAEDRVRGGRAQTHEHLGMHRLQLRFQPGPAGEDLRLLRRLVQSALAGVDELEMLDDVGEVELAAVEAHLAERAVEDLARRAHERQALPVLLVSRLLADQSETRRG